MPPRMVSQRFRLAFEQSMAGTILVDLEDKVLEVNDAFCQMVGYNRDEIVAKRSELFTRSEDYSISEEAHRRLTSGEVDQVSYTKRYLRKNGQVIVAEVSKSALRDRDGVHALLRHLGPGRHGGTGAQRPALPPGTARLAHGASQPGAVREPALSSSREDSPARRVERRAVVGPR